MRRTDAGPGGPKGRADFLTGEPIAYDGQTLQIAHPTAPPRIDPNRPTWRVRGGHYLRPKIATKDLSKLDLSHQLAHGLDPTDANSVKRELRDIVSSLDPKLRDGLRDAVLRERGVARRSPTDGSELVARSAVAAALRERYGFLPKFQLRWCGRI